MSPSRISLFEFLCLPVVFPYNTICLTRRLLLSLQSQFPEIQRIFNSSGFYYTFLIHINQMIQRYLPSYFSLNRSIYHYSSFFSCLYLSFNAFLYILICLCVVLIIFLQNFNAFLFVPILLVHNSLIYLHRLPSWDNISTFFRFSLTVQDNSFQWMRVVHCIFIG